MSNYRKFKDYEKQLEETKGSDPQLFIFNYFIWVWNSVASMCALVALAKEDGTDPEMQEMIAYEIETLSKQLKEFEEKLKVWHQFSLSFDVLTYFNTFGNFKDCSLFIIGTIAS